MVKLADLLPFVTPTFHIVLFALIFTFVVYAVYLYNKRNRKFLITLIILILLILYFYLLYSDKIFWMLKSILLLFLVFFLPGYALFNALIKHKITELSFSESLFVFFVTSLLISGWISLLLSSLGLFSILNLVAIIIIFSIPLIGLKFFYKSKPVPLEGPKINRNSIILVSLILTSTILFFQPYFPEVGLDSIIIISHAVNIAKTGSNVAFDPLIEEVGTEFRDVIYHKYKRYAHYGFQNLEFPGYGFYYNNNSNFILFQYFDFYPILLSIIYSVLGLEFFLYFTPFIATVSLISVYFLTRRLFGDLIAFISLILLQLNFAQIFFARYPGAEILFQMLVFTGLYALHMWLHFNRSFFAFLSALSFGTLVLVRPDFPLIYPAIVILLSVMMFSKNPKKGFIIFYATFFLVNVASIIYIYKFDLPYFLDQIPHFLRSNTNLLISLLIMPTLLPVLFFIPIKKLNPRINPNRTKIIFELVTFLVFLSFIFAYFLRPQIEVNFNKIITIYLLEYSLSQIGLVFGIFGIASLLHSFQKLEESKKLTIIVFILIGISYTAFYLEQLRNQSIFFPWPYRRYITVIIPFFTILISYTLCKFYELRKNVRDSKFIFYILIFFLVSYSISTSVNYASDFSKKFSMTTLDFEAFSLSKNFIFESKNVELSNLIANESIAVFPQKSYVIRGIILKYIYDKNVIVLPEESKKAAVLFKKWAEEGKNVLIIDPTTSFMKTLVSLGVSYEPVCSSMNVFRLKKSDEYILEDPSPYNVVEKDLTKILNINCIPKLSLYQHPISNENRSLIIFENVKIPENAKLKFSIALHPQVWNPNKGDGVVFEVFIEHNGEKEKIFSKYIDPKNNPEERKWNDFEIDLSKYSGKNVTIIFSTLPGPNNDSRWDWAWWGEPRVEWLNS